MVGLVVCEMVWSMYPHMDNGSFNVSAIIASLSLEGKAENNLRSVSLVWLSAMQRSHWCKDSSRADIVGVYNAEAFLRSLRCGLLQMARAAYGIDPSRDLPQKPVHWQGAYSSPAEIKCVDPEGLSVIADLFEVG